METWNPETEPATVLLKVNRGAYIAVQVPTGRLDEKDRAETLPQRWSGVFKSKPKPGAPQDRQLFWVGEQFWAPKRLAKNWTSGNPPLANQIGTRTDEQAEGGIDPTQDKKPKRRAAKQQDEPDGELVNGPNDLVVLEE